MNLVLRILSIPLLAFTGWVLFMFGQVAMMEGYNPIDPDIDTHYTAQFSETGFAAIMVGADTTTVYSLIGHPIEIQELNDGEQIWYYTGDGKCSWDDFAWLGREVYIKDGRVQQVTMPIHYD